MKQLKYCPYCGSVLTNRQSPCDQCGKPLQPAPQVGIEGIDFNTKREKNMRLAAIAIAIVAVLLAGVTLMLSKQAGPQTYAETEVAQYGERSLDESAVQADMPTAEAQTDDDAAVEEILKRQEAMSDEEYEAQMQGRAEAQHEGHVRDVAQQACQRLLTEDDIATLSARDLKIVRNWIFARHGYRFKTADMQQFFANEDWYEGRYDDVSQMLSDTERKNVQFVKRHE